MTLVPLIDGRTGEEVGVTIIDATDTAAVKAHTWRLAHSGYAVRWRDGQTVYLHRELLGLVRGDGLEGDHINRDKLDNRRANLRVATRRENSQNLPSQAGTSRHRGVAYDRIGRRWTAQVKLDGRKHSLGSFATEDAAARAAANFRAAHMPFSTDAGVSA